MFESGTSGWTVGVGEGGGVKWGRGSAVNVSVAEGVTVAGTDVGISIGFAGVQAGQTCDEKATKITV